MKIGLSPSQKSKPRFNREKARFNSDEYNFKDTQKYDIYTNEEGMYELLFSSQQPKAKDFRRHCCNVLFPHVRQQPTNKMKKDHQQAIEERCSNCTAQWWPKKSWIWERRPTGWDKGKGPADSYLAKTLCRLSFRRRQKQWHKHITKNNEEAEYPYISICRQNYYRRHKARVLLACNQGSILFADGDAPNAIMYNFWWEHRLIVVDPGRPRYFRLDMINQEQLLALNDT